ncbi:MAG: DUF2784 domain-containing protein [Nitrospirales bacterium]|nr:DUF2784 domain-containing protein [Nitrospirales bacterium]
MFWRILADLVLLVHLSFILFVIVGGFLALRWRGLAWIHLPAMVWGVAIEFGGWICPLTPLENWLLRAGGLAGYSGGFIERYVLPIIYPIGLTPKMQMYLGAGILVINLVAYALYYRRWSKED